MREDALEVKTSRFLDSVYRARLAGNKTKTLAPDYLAVVYVACHTAAVCQTEEYATAGSEYLRAEVLNGDSGSAMAGVVARSPWIIKSSLARVLTEPGNQYLVINVLFRMRLAGEKTIGAYIF